MIHCELFETGGLGVANVQLEKFIENNHIVASQIIKIKFSTCCDLDNNIVDSILFIYRDKTKNDKIYEQILKEEGK